MDDATLGALVFFGTLVLAWCGWITYRIENMGGVADDVSERFDTIEDGIEKALNGMQTLAGFLSSKFEDLDSLKEYLPQFHINESPLKPLMDIIMQNFSESSNAPNKPGPDRAPDGTFTQELISDGEKESET